MVFEVSLSYVAEDQSFIGSYGMSVGKWLLAF